MSSFQFNALLLEISNQLSSEQLDKLKFLCRDLVGKRDLEKTDTGRRLFQILTERGRLAPDNTEYLCRLLTEIHREDIAEKLSRFECPPGCPEVLDKAETDKLDIATNVISENLGKNWRKLGRKLGLSEVKLESISKRHPTELDETVIELLKEWRKIQRAEARTEELIKALRACQFNLTADKVEKRLAENQIRD
ncbi:FAS-associated death domain protein [Morone saxatilis]|uniref:FAS-associated death domain protein n=1 Tax=Morone saxatilis TaxID=34816 RepID=UPI0015E23E98|nr:FAS-associated death domain protein [Morone saxatilis]